MKFHKLFTEKLERADHFPLVSDTIKSNNLRSARRSSTVSLSRFQFFGFSFLSLNFW